MINHARTLLLNRTGSAGFNPILCEEIIPADYVAKTTPSYISNIRRVLFGANPDKYMLNYRGRQLMAMLHASELEEFVLELDPRITYSFDNSDATSDKLFVPIVTRTDSESDHNDLFIGGDVPIPDYSGRMHYAWTVEWDNTNNLTKATLLKPHTAQSQAPSFTSSLLSPVTLPGTNMNYRHLDTNSNNSWRVSQLCRPVETLADLVPRLEALNGESMLELFGVGTSRASSEPFKTFYNLWRGHFALPYKLGGLVLALIYRMDELE